MILLDSNTFYAEVDYDNMNNQINLVKGHYWAFDGQKAWRDIKERWAQEITEWEGVILAVLVVPLLSIIIHFHILIMKKIMSQIRMLGF